MFRVTNRIHLTPSGVVSQPYCYHWILLQSAGVFRIGVILPFRSSQTIAVALVIELCPVTYASVPALDTANCADPLVMPMPTSSSTGTACPVTSSRAGSNGAANNDPSWTYTRCPLAKYRPKYPL